jgi:hypothetical protein
MAVAAAMCGPVRAENQVYDTVKLKDGSVLTCQVLEETKDQVILTMGGVERKFSRGLIKSVSFGTGAPEASAVPSVSATPAASGAKPGPETGPALDAGLARQYSVPVNDVAWVRQQGIPERDLPLVFFISARARVAPAAVVNLRLGGLAWAEIADRYELAPEAFNYVPYYYVYPAVSVLFWGWPFRWGWGWHHHRRW